MHRVDDGDLQRRVLGGDVDRLHPDQIGEPLLQAGLDRLLLRGGEHVAVGREDELRGAAAEGRSVDAFARRGEQDLLDHVADVRQRIGLRGVAGGVEAVGKGEFMCAAQIAVTRVCVTSGKQRRAGGSADRLAALHHQRLAVGGDARRADDPLRGDAGRHGRRNAGAAGDDPRRRAAGTRHAVRA